jgi:(2Fe-2S) ferredoxin
MATHTQRHVLLCADTEREGCASAKRMRRAWKHLEKAVEKAGLEGKVLCTRTRCFGICDDGPIAVVYPEGTWYGEFEEGAIDRIVEEHLAEGRVVKKFARPEPEPGD